ncbi:hypothetical protein CF319_g2063 [Tilletia indica]|nr:hypothetical protein CF319_g2063 [Tilletia indica]
MCNYTSVTVLCAICEVNVVDRRVEQQACLAVRAGRFCPEEATRLSGTIGFRQEVGLRLCESCTEDIIARRGDEGRVSAAAADAAETARAAHTYPSLSDGASLGDGRRRAGRGSLGDQELTLNSQWRWDDRFSRPESSSPTVSSPSTPSTPADESSQGSSESGSQPSRPESRATSDTNNSSQSSDLANSSQFVGGDRNLSLHSARYWD